MQAKLLRVLESGEIRRVGENAAVRIDVRVVCATHRNLEEMVQDGTFREDLLFRINPFRDPRPLPARTSERYRADRKSSLSTISSGNGSTQRTLLPETIAELKSHVWPGNVRELANVIEHATILCDEPPILPEHLPRHFADRRLRREARSVGPMSLKQLEEVAIVEAVQRHQGNKAAAAEELGISLKTLYNKLNQSEFALKKSA